MKVININNAEDIILAKHEIEDFLIESNKISNKLSFEDFINNYINLSYALYKNGNVYPFGILHIKDGYLFITSENSDIKLLLSKLELVKYNLQTIFNKNEVSSDEVFKDDNNELYIIADSKYYIL